MGDTGATIVIGLFTLTATVLVMWLIARGSPPRGK